MEDRLRNILKQLKLNENTISTILGGIVVIVIGIVIFNYLNKNRIPQVGQIPSQAISETASPTANTTTAPTLTEENGQQVPQNLPMTYTVQKGDDLWHIAQKFYTSGYNWVDIAKENNLKNPGQIHPGNQLTLPKVAVKLASGQLKTTPSTTTVSQANRPNAINGDSYTTVKGDHLWGIAVRAYGDGFAWTKIYNANKDIIGNTPSALLIGKKLSIPR